MLELLPTDLLCRLIVTLNGGTIAPKAKPKVGYLYPGYQGGRELHYFQISRDAMAFWKHVCSFMRLNSELSQSVHNMLFSEHEPKLEVWYNQDMYDQAYWSWEDDVTERFVPRHLYAGNADPWMARLCYGPQCAEGESDQSA